VKTTPKLTLSSQKTQTLLLLAKMFHRNILVDSTEVNHNRMEDDKKMKRCDSLIIFFECSDEEVT
jgi:hypothetical protein